jgi:hypothetical protein
MRKHSTPFSIRANLRLAGPAAEVELLVNARVEMPPETLQDIVASQLKEVCRALRLTHSIRAKSLGAERPRATLAL